MDTISRKFGKSKRTREVLGAKKIFGEMFDGESDCLPVVVEKVIRYFDNAGVEFEGLFRISGQQSVIKKLIDEFDSGINPDLTIYDPHAVAGLLKQYLRELPEPLLTFELYDCFLAAASVPEDMEVEAIQKVLTMLPRANRIIFKAIASFMSRVSKRSEVNKMRAENLAIVFAPNLLKPMGDDIMTQMLDTEYTNKLMVLIVSEYESIFKNEPDPSQTHAPLVRGHRRSRSWTPCLEERDILEAMIVQDSSPRPVFKHRGISLIAKDESDLKDLIHDSRDTPVFKHRGISLIASDPLVKDLLPKQNLPKPKLNPAPSVPRTFQESASLSQSSSAPQLQFPSKLKKPTQRPGGAVKSPQKNGATKPLAHKQSNVTGTALLSRSAETPVIKLKQSPGVSRLKPVQASSLPKSQETPLPMNEYKVLRNTMQQGIIKSASEKQLRRAPNSPMARPAHQTKKMITEVQSSKNSNVNKPSHSTQKLLSPDRSIARAPSPQTKQRGANSKRDVSPHQIVVPPGSPQNHRNRGRGQGQSRGRGNTLRSHNTANTEPPKNRVAYEAVVIGDELGIALDELARNKPTSFAPKPPQNNSTKGNMKNLQRGNIRGRAQRGMRGRGQRGKQSSYTPAQAPRRTDVIIVD